MNWNRISSGVVALGYILAAFFQAGGEAAFMVGLCVMFPLACIWFADAMGGYTGTSVTIGITATSPGFIVCFLGWLVLTLPIIILIISALAGAKR